ncbi:MAG TPA: hypothetical protein VFC17_04350 [Candidatus Limnocylindrales bacterium]|nr:hypothetical protein [Candidatus Limnocylindrales bacterium]
MHRSKCFIEVGRHGGHRKPQKVFIKAEPAFIQFRRGAADGFDLTKISRRDRPFSGARDGLGFTPFTEHCQELFCWRGICVRSNLPMMTKNKQPAAGAFFARK